MRNFYLALVAVFAATCYLTGHIVTMWVLAAYLSLLIAGRLTGQLGFGVRESKFSRMYQSPEYGGYQSKFVLLIVRVCYELVCHFGLWKNDLVVRGIAVARKH